MDILKLFNVNIYVPKSDTCQKCDAYNVKLKCAVKKEEINQLKQERLAHQKGQCTPDMR